MSQSVKDAILVWSAPAMLAVILVLSGFIFNAQQERIGALETTLAANQNTLAVISSTQVSSRQDRVDFQVSVDKRLERIETVLSNVGEAVVRLTALQETAQGQRRP